MTYNFDEIIDRRNTNSENVEGWAALHFPLRAGEGVPLQGRGIHPDVGGGHGVRCGA